MKNIKKNILLLICLFFAALNFNLILKPLNLVTGGTQGLAIILNHLLKVKPSIIVLVINIIALIISFFFLTKDNTYSALLSTFAYPFFIKVTSYIPLINFSEKFTFLLAILAGIICGLTGGFIYKLGFSSGGITIVNLLTNKYLKWKISISNFIINTIIIILGYFHFGLKKAIYSIVVIGVGSIIINFILKKDKSIKKSTI